MERRKLGREFKVEAVRLWRRSKPDALLHHSDHGSQYTGGLFQRLMAEKRGEAGQPRFAF